jgi:hypothetical protein
VMLSSTTLKNLKQNLVSASRVSRTSSPPRGGSQVGAGIAAGARQPKIIERSGSVELARGGITGTRYRITFRYLTQMCSSNIYVVDFINSLSIDTKDGILSPICSFK